MLSSEEYRVLADNLEPILPFARIEHQHPNYCPRSRHADKAELVPLPFYSSVVDVSKEHELTDQATAETVSRPRSFQDRTVTCYLTDGVLQSAALADPGDGTSMTIH